MTAFLLQYAKTAPPEFPWESEIEYDPERQLSVKADGIPVVKDPKLLAESGATTSTAGSKTHFDD